MRNEENSSRLTAQKAFSLNRVDEIDNFETGLSGSLGFDYQIENNDIKKFDFSLAQVINEKENKKRHSKSSLDEKVSDLVGFSNFNVNDKLNLNYNFAIDQNYSDFNYNEFGAKVDFDKFTINFDYLEKTII